MRVLKNLNVDFCGVYIDGQGQNNYWNCDCLPAETPN